ncbi:MAG TPA: zinc ribbon domain-containing protein [Candidatus Saccharimonadales bacterium]|jgi:hypothetical protein|nr:zinc ribbon domain-containing protein [Candidatus Saccharimonadales bacterium]
MSRFCGQCGEGVGEDATFCGGCGANLHAKGEPQPDVLPKQALANPATIQASDSKNKILLYAAGAVLAVLALAIGGAIYAARRVSGEASHLARESGLATILKSVSSSPAGGTDAAESEPEKPPERNVCGLISKGEVEKATGVSVSGTSLNEERDVCTYAPAEDGMVTVTVGVEWQNGKFAMRALPAMSKQLINEDLRQPVSGIGDEAYLLGVDKDTERQFEQVPKELRAVSSFTTGPLVFRKGDVMVTVTATFAEKKSDVERQIAAIVADRV